jgi:hypothetical protein
VPQAAGLLHALLLGDEAQGDGLGAPRATRRLRAILAAARAEKLGERAVPVRARHRQEQGEEDGADQRGGAEPREQGGHGDDAVRVSHRASRG